MADENVNAAQSAAAETVMLPEHPTLEQMVEFFRKDAFAYDQAGCRIVEGWCGHGVCEMEIKPHHRNAEGNVMGGAIFTLADYAFAVATMCGSYTSVSLTSTIEFMRASRGSKLIATCDVDRSGRKVGFYTVEVADDLGERIAKVVTTGYRSPAA